MSLPCSLIEKIYMQNFSWLVRWLTSRARCAELAQDLGQDAFVRLIDVQQLESLQSPRAWLIVVANRLMINHFRRHAIEGETLQQLVVMMREDVGSAENEISSRDLLIKAVHLLMAELPERHFESLIMSRVYGMTYQEIAKELGVTPHSVKYYIVSAISAIHDQLFSSELSFPTNASTV